MVRPFTRAPLKPNSGDRALELVGCRLRVGGRDRGERGEPVGVRTDRLVEPVIGAARQSDGGLRVELLQPGIGVRQHLHIDAGLVHLSEAQFADIVEPLDDPRRIGRLLTDGVTLHLGVEVMLFQGDDVGFGRHCAPPRVIVADF